MSSTSETPSTEIRCSNCNKCLAKDGQIQCSRCGTKNEIPTPAELSKEQTAWLDREANFLAAWILSKLSTRSIKPVEQVKFDDAERPEISDRGVLAATMGILEEKGWFVRYRIEVFAGGGGPSWSEQSFLVSRVPFKPRTRLGSVLLRWGLYPTCSTFDMHELQTSRICGLE
jgi:phage FluMu protein Com